jgi:hypothetical protein
VARCNGAGPLRFMSDDHTAKWMQVRGSWFPFRGGESLHDVVGVPLRGRGCAILLCCGGFDVSGRGVLGETLISWHAIGEREGRNWA